MARAFSDDLRCRFLRAYGRGEGSLRELGERFGVSWDYGKKIRQQQLHSGQMERMEQSRHGPMSRVTPEVQQQLRAAVGEEPDRTLAELQRQVQQRTGLGMSRSLVWQWLQRLGLGRKKNRSMPRSATARRTSNGGKSSCKRSAPFRQSG